jgi:hypothetical protein
VLLLLVALVVVAAIWWSGRVNELFCLSVRDGKVLVVRGRIPGGLLAEFREVVSRPPVRRATVRAVKGAHGVELRCSGALGEGRQQRLRNCLGVYPMSRLRAAPPLERATVGQIIGIAWLAWMLDRSSHG